MNTDTSADQPMITITHNGADRQIPLMPDTRTVGQLHALAVEAFGLSGDYAFLSGLFLANGVELFPNDEPLDDYAVEPGDLLVLRPRIVRA